MFKVSISLQTLTKREVRRFFVVATQTILPPLVSSALFMFVFGMSLGQRLTFNMHGLSYMEFMIPGLITMHLIEGSYANTSSSLFMSRWQNLIQEILLSPMAYHEMVIGLIAGGVSRGLITASGVFLVSRLFCPVFEIHSALALLFFSVLITLIFSCLGMLVGLWAESFENLSIWSAFVLSPLIYFGGVFHRPDMMMPALRWLLYANPIFYMVSAIRYSLTGHSDASILHAGFFLSAMCVFLFCAVLQLFRSGYKLRK